MVAVTIDDTDLAHFVRTASLIDTHEHMHTEETVVAAPPDILVDLFDNYVTADLIVAGASPDTVKRLIDPADTDIAARFHAIEPVWNHSDIPVMAKRCAELPEHFTVSKR